MKELLEEVKIIRKRLGITQQELAKLSGVSQSLITKIEAGTLDPSFTNAKKIFDALNQLHEKKSVKAKDLMNTKLVSLTSTATLKDAITKMKKHGISQIPLIEQGTCCGIVTESTILEVLLKDLTLDHQVKDVALEAPPLIDQHATREVIVGLLRYYPIVLIGEKGKILGFITKADVLEKI